MIVSKDVFDCRNVAMFFSKCRLKIKNTCHFRLTSATVQLYRNYHFLRIILKGGHFYGIKSGRNQKYI
jgi:hypothetical protein